MWRVICLGHQFHILGADVLIHELDKRASMHLIKETVKVNGGELESAVKANAVFRGHYRGKQFIRPTGDTGRSVGLRITADGMAAIVAPTTHYSVYLEYGTRFMDSQPFIRPAYRIQRQIFKADLKRLMK